MESILLNFDFVEATVAFGVDGEAEGFEGLKVRFNGASAKGTATGVGDAEFGVTMEEWS